MPEARPESDYFLKHGDVVSVGVDLPDMTFVEDMATVICCENGEIMLQLCGSGVPKQISVISGARVLISKREGATLFQCTAMLKSAAANGHLRIGLPKKVVACERREYMRIDLTLPVNYYLPQSQNMAQVIAEWESAIECNGAGLNLPEEKREVNLSGGGLRLKTSDRFPCGTLLHLSIALTGEKQHHIHAVGSIVRSKELLSDMNRIESYSTSMSFRIIASSDRQKLSRHILEEQRKKVTPKHESYL